MKNVHVFEGVLYIILSSQQLPKFRKAEVMQSSSSRNEDSDSFSS